MQGYSDGRKRLRIGKYRIIYNYGLNGEIKVLYIMDVDTRGDIYKQKGSVCMSAATKEAINLMEILPESDQNFALEFIKKLVLAWDPDYTKVTPVERKALEEAEKDIAENGTISHDAINWDQEAREITVSKAQQKATKEWEKRNYDSVNLRLPKGTKERIKNVSETVNGFIVTATLEKLEKEESEEK